MARFLVLTFFCLVFGAATVKEIAAAKVCGLERLESDDPRNSSYVVNVLSPKLMNWFRNGKPEYFLQAVDSLFYDNLGIPVEDGVYYLSNVTVVGGGDSYLSYFIYDNLYTEKSCMNYTYVINLKVNADSIYKVNESEEKITCDKPLSLKLRDVKVNSITPTTFFKRCDGTEYQRLNDDSLTIEGYPESCVTYKTGTPIKCDLQDFNRGIIDTIGKLVMSLLNSNFRTIYKEVDVNELMLVDPVRQKKKYQRCCQ